MKKLKLNKKGFTIIELVAVMVILAALMAVSTPMIINSMNRQEVTNMRKDVTNIVKAVDQYRDMELRYLDSTPQIIIKSKSDWEQESSTLDWSNAVGGVEDITRAERLYFLPVRGRRIEDTTNGTLGTFEYVDTITLSQASPSNMKKVYEALKKEIQQNTGTDTTITAENIETIPLFRLNTSQLYGLLASNDLDDYVIEPITGHIVYRYLVRGTDGYYYTGSLRVEGVTDNEGRPSKQNAIPLW